MWCSRGCLGTPAMSDAWLCHVSIVGGARRRGCAAGGVPVFFRGLLADERGVAHEDEDAPGVQRGDVLLGGRRIEPGGDEHLLEVAVGGDADVRHAVLVARDGLAVDVRESAAPRVRAAGEGTRCAGLT